MQELAQGHRVARFVLRGLLLAAAAFVAVLIGASAAQADDSGPAREDASGHRLGAVVGDARSAVGTSPRSVHRVAETAETAAHTATATLREVSQRAPVTRPVAEVVAAVADRTVERLSEPIEHTARSVDELVGGPVTDAVDEVLAPVLPPAVPDAEADGRQAGQQERGPGAAEVRDDRRPDRSGSAAPGAGSPAAESVFSTPAPAPRGASAHTPHDVPPLDEIPALGAFSGAPSTGSGAAGGPASAGMLPSGPTAPADVSLGVVAHADDERLFALPLTPGWSPD